MAALLVVTATAAIAQPQAPAANEPQDDWKVAIYPIFVWVPLGIDIDVEVPPFEGGAAVGPARSSIAASMVRSWEGFPPRRVFSGSTVMVCGRRSVEIARSGRF